MKLLRMTATFGRLEQETLSLTEGLNVLQMPNEAGKSTWAEFLLAMLYGVDTSEREKTGVLPVKTKYQPWSGKPMEGVIELEHAGRRITLTRTSTARAPLGVFSAVYTDSGLPVEGMTGANCGETLLGVPKRVYQRSAFVRQAGLGLTPDDELEARLSALVTTGDEAVSFAAADKRLLAWQNRVRHNKTGLIPDAERELAAVDSALAALAGEHEKNLALRAQLQSLQAQQTACEEDLRALQAAQAQRKKAQLYDAKRAAMQAANRENAASAVCARLPREDALAALSQEAAALLSLPELEAAAAAPARPDCPKAFSGVDEERLLDKAQRDMREFDRLTAKKHRLRGLMLFLTFLAGLLPACTQPDNAIPENGILINEVVASNKRSLTDAAWGSPDWIELYNGSQIPVDLSGWYLTDNVENEGKLSPLPKRKLAPGEYLILYANGESAENCLDFSLSRKGETLTLVNPRREAVTTLEIPALVKDVS